MVLLQKTEIFAVQNKIAKNDQRVNDFQQVLDNIRKEAENLREQFRDAVLESQGLVGNAQALQATVKGECAALIDQAKEKIASIDKLK